VVFLIKMSAVWHVIGVSIDPDTRTKPLITAVVAAMRDCRAGANHILYKMATGFERMLEKGADPGERDAAAAAAAAAENLVRMNTAINTNVNGDGHFFDNGRHVPNGAFATHALPPQLTPATGHNLLPQSQPLGGFVSPAPPMGGFDPYLGQENAGWQMDDDVLWSMVGTEYDLLANAPDTDMSLYAFHDGPYTGK